MPRSGVNGTYTLPPNTDNQQPLTPISSSMFNAAMDDVEQTFNSVQPIAYGGTGANDASSARTALGTNDAANLTTGLINADRVPATLTPNKAFRQGNILGTVSQSGGVPTGAIIERGSNANGEYVRFADGTQICLIYKSVTEEISTANGSLYYSSLTNHTWPASFSAVPTVSVEAYRAGAVTFGTAAPGSNTTQAAVRALCGVSVASGGTIYNIIGIGRWF